MCETAEINDKEAIISTEKTYMYLQDKNFLFLNFDLYEIEILLEIDLPTCAR